MSEINNEAIDLAKKVEEYSKNPTIGINTGKLIAFCNGMQFKINPDGHTKTIRDKIIKSMLDYENGAKQLIKENASELQQQLYIEKGSRDILEAGLIDFDYDVAANDPRCGDVALNFLANELGSFLVVQGGKAGTKHLQTLQQLEALRAYGGLKDSQKNGTSIASTLTE